jgi:twitching motility protein PilT
MDSLMKQCVVRLRGEMDGELKRLLEYLDQDGVTELVLGTGQPLTLRRAGAYTAVSTELVTRAHIARWLLGSGFEVAMPDGEGFGEPADVEVGSRRYAAQITRRGDDVIVRIEVSKTPPPARTKSRAAVRTPPQPSPVVAAPPPTPPVPLPPPRPTPVPGSVRAPTAPVEIAAPVAPKSPPAGPPPVDEVNFNIPSVLELGPAIAEAALAPPPARGDTYEMLPDLMPDVPLAVAAMETTLPPKPSGPPPPATYVTPASSAAAKAATVSAPISTTPSAAARAAAVAASIDVPRTITKTPPAEGPVARASGQPKPKLPEADTVPLGGPPTLTSPAPPAVARTPTPIQIPRTISQQKAAPSAQRSLRDADEKPNIELIAQVVRAARQRGASDLHIAANRPLLMRAMGELVPLDRAALPPKDVEAILLPLLGVVSRETLASRGYVDIAIEIPAAGRLRGNVSRIQGGLKGSFRLGYPKPPTLEELNLPKELAKVVSHHQGLVVFAGPSGHGKTTTLAALVDLINSTRPHHILTVEDPVEIEHPRKRAVVSQREVGRHTRSFATALKASLREDPDVIVIGELRDRETVEIALTAAETGHLVMATMSTPSAAKTIDRLIDMFPPDDQQQVRSSLGGALRAIVAQRLVPRTDNGAVLPAVELLTGVLPLVALIRDNKLFQLPNLMQRGRAFGMIRLDDSLAELVRSGQVSEEAALRVADSKRELTTILRGGVAAVAAASAPPAVPGAAAKAATPTPAGGVPITPGAPAKKGGLAGIFGRKDKE